MTPSHAPTPPVVSVIGLGLLGRGIVACLLSRGFHVHAVEPDEAVRLEALASLHHMIPQATPENAPPWKHRLHIATDLSAMPPCNLVLESVSESPVVKQQVYDALESLLPPETVIASNTSSLSIAELQRQRQHPERFLAMHWAMPAHLTRFMEIVPGPQTSPAAVEHALSWARRLDKDPCLCHEDLPGFLVNRIGYAMYREALHLLQSGVADADTIDRACRNALGLWASFCGPLRWIDLTGGPALYAAAMQGVLPTLNAANCVPDSLARLADNGEHFYPYPEGEMENWRQRYDSHAAAISAMLNQEHPLPPATTF